MDAASSISDYVGSNSYQPLRKSANINTFTTKSNDNLLANVFVRDIGIDLCQIYNYHLIIYNFNTSWKQTNK